MRLLATLVLALLPLSSFASSYQDIVNVLHRVQYQYSNLRDKSISIYVDHSDHSVNAEMKIRDDYNGFIRITMSMMNHFYHSDLSQAAAVIGHELSHFANRDDRSCYNRYQCEKRADLQGKQKAIQAGFACEGAANGFRYLLSLGIEGDGKSHPYTSDRIKYLTCRR